jgi:hypothetical protein
MGPLNHGLCSVVFAVLVFRKPMNDATKKRWKIRPRFRRLSVFHNECLAEHSVLWNVHPAAGRGVTVLAKTKGKRVALCLHVSTPEQSTHNPRRELQAVAVRHEWLRLTAEA